MGPMKVFLDQFDLENNEGLCGIMRRKFGIPEWCSINLSIWKRMVQKDGPKMIQNALWYREQLSSMLLWAFYYPNFLKKKQIMRDSVGLCGPHFPPGKAGRKTLVGVTLPPTHLPISNHLRSSIQKERPVFTEMPQKA